MTARLLVSGARVLTPGGEWPRGWIAVEGRRIAAMGQGEPPPGAGYVLSAARRRHPGEPTTIWARRTFATP